MKNNKKILLSLGTLAAVAIPATAVVSCGIKATTPKDYTVGFAIDPISSLNYIKYKSTITFAHGLVEGLMKSGPESNSALKNYLKDLPKPYANYENGYLPQDLSSYGMMSGTLRKTTSSPDSVSDTALVVLPEPNANGKILSADVGDKQQLYDVNLNGSSKWANGDMLTSSNFIDFIAYVTDLNTGSQLIQDIEAASIDGVDNFVNAQTEYAKKFGALYKNPFGYIPNPKYASASAEDKKFLPAEVQRTDAFPLQENKSGEREIVNKIESAARNIGVYGDASSSHPYSMSDNEKEYMKNYPDEDSYSGASAQEVNDWLPFNMSDGKNYTVGDDSITPYKLRFKTKMPIGSFYWLVNSLSSTKMLPVNRRFVESTGGVEKFGLDSSSFLAEGPFKLKELILGQAGSAVLEKDINYHESEFTIPESVKVYFQSDPIIKSSLFEDGYISQTKLTAITAKKLYAQELYRPMVTKAAGYGTTGLVFNLDPNSEGYNKYLADPDLRKAIFYSVDRGEIIKLSGFDATTPSYALTDQSSGISAEWVAPQQGVSVALHGSNAEYLSKHGDKVKLFPYTQTDYVGQGVLLGNLDKTDKTKNYETAKYYYNKFKAKYPNAGTVKIEFTNDSTKASINIGTTLQTQMNEALGKGALDIELKSYPKSIFDSFYAAGKFQMAYKNMDYLDHGGDSYAGAFMTPDSISKEDQKLTGFVNNPSGAWTFEKIFALSDAEQTEMRERLKIPQFIWNKIKELSTPSTVGSTPEEKLTNQKNIIDAFFARSEIKDENNQVTIPLDTDFDTAQEVANLIIAVNKLIMEENPVIPLFVVDVRMQAIRMAGYSIESKGGMDSFDYAYDLVRRPRADLPGLEALEG